MRVYMEQSNIIWFYFITPLGQRVNFIWCMCWFFFLSLSISPTFRRYMGQKICIKRNHITTYQIQMMWVFHWNTIHCDWKHVSINLCEMWTSTWIYFVCQRRHKKSKRREKNRKKPSFVALECVSKDERSFFSLFTERIRLDFSHSDSLASFFRYFVYLLPHIQWHTDAVYYLSCQSHC